MTKPRQDFTPALGQSRFTSDYDRVIAVMTREKRWRARLVDSMATGPRQVVVDLGSGTGSLAIMLKQRCPATIVFAVDPDPEIRIIGETKARQADVEIAFLTALGGDAALALPYGKVDAVVSSLVLHQCAEEAKRALLANAYALLRPGGRIFVADYGVQPTLLMQILFNQVRSLDGYGNTRANKDGLIPQLIVDAGFVGISEDWRVLTPSGAMYLWTATKSER